MENEKLGQEPIVPTIFRKVGDNEFRVASERDVNDHHATLIRTEGMSKRFYAACQILKSIVNSNSPISLIKADVSIAYRYADELLKQEKE